MKLIFEFLKIDNYNKSILKIINYKLNLQINESVINNLDDSSINKEFQIFIEYNNDTSLNFLLKLKDISNNNYTFFCY